MTLLRRVLRNAWTLAPFERVSRHFHLTAERRGVYEIGPVGLAVGDLFGREAAADTRPVIDRFLVRPRTVPSDVLHGTCRAEADVVSRADRRAVGDHSSNVRRWLVPHWKN